MSNFRIDRTNDDIRRVISEKLREVKDPRVHQGLVSVLRADTTRDLHYCKIYLSVLGEYDAKEMKKGLKSASGWLRRELGNSLSLRATPELVFELDDSIEHGAHINELIEKLDIRHDDDDE